MKNLKTLLPFILSIILISCSSGGSEAGDTNEADSTANEPQVEDYSDMREADLSEYGIAASIMTPPDTKGKLEIEETSYGSVVVRVGEKFGLEIVPFGFTVEEAKEELDQGGVYTIEIIEEQENYILYKRTIPNAEVKEEFHFFLSTEMDGEIYEIRSLGELELKEAQARNLLKAAKSFGNAAEV